VLNDQLGGAERAQADRVGASHVAIDGIERVLGLNRVVRFATVHIDCAMSLER
jgi:hypothetical protein